MLLKRWSDSINPWAKPGTVAAPPAKPAEDPAKTSGGWFNWAKFW